MSTKHIRQMYDLLQDYPVDLGGIDQEAFVQKMAEPTNRQWLKSAIQQMNTREDLPTLDIGSDKEFEFYMRPADRPSARPASLPTIPQEQPVAAATPKRQQAPQTQQPAAAPQERIDPQQAEDAFADIGQLAQTLTDSDMPAERTQQVVQNYAEQLYPNLTPVLQPELDRLTQGKQGPPDLARIVAQANARRPLRSQEADQLITGVKHPKIQAIVEKAEQAGDSRQRTLAKIESAVLEDLAQQRKTLGQQQLPEEDIPDRLHQYAREKYPGVYDRIQDQIVQPDAPSLEALGFGSPTLDETLTSAAPQSTAVPIRTKDEQESAGMGGSYIGQFGRRVAAGSAELGRMIAGSPAFLYEVAALPQNVIGETFDLEGLQVKAPEALVQNPVAQYYQQAADQWRASTEQYDKTITGYLKSGEIGKAAELTGLQVAENLPLQIALLATGVAGGSRSAVLGGMSLLTGARKKQELDTAPGESPAAQMSEALKTLNAVTHGAAEGASELLGTAQLGKMAGALYKQFGRETGEQILKDAFQSSVGRIIKRFGWKAAPLIEGIEEYSNEWIQNLNDIVTGADPERGLFDNTLDALIVGMAASGTTTVPMATIGKLQQAQRNQDWDEALRAVEEMEQQAQAESDQQVIDALREYYESIKEPTVEEVLERGTTQAGLHPKITPERLQRTTPTQETAQRTIEESLEPEEPPEVAEQERIATREAQVEATGEPTIPAPGREVTDPEQLQRGDTVLGIPFDARYETGHLQFTDPISETSITLPPDEVEAKGLQTALADRLQASRERYGLAEEHPVERPESPTAAPEGELEGKVPPTTAETEIGEVSATEEPSAEVSQQKQPWEDSDLATSPNIPAGRVTAKKQANDKYKLFYRGTSNEVFEGQEFDTADEAREFFKVQKARAQQAQQAQQATEPKTFQSETPDETLTIYRGGTQPGQYYSTDPAFAQEFTPSGQPEDVEQRDIPREQVLDLSRPEHQAMVRESYDEATLQQLQESSPNDWPSANDPEMVAQLEAIAPALGFTASMQSEGQGQPPSVYLYEGAQEDTSAEPRDLLQQAAPQTQTRHTHQRQAGFTLTDAIEGKVERSDRNYDRYHYQYDQETDRTFRWEKPQKVDDITQTINGKRRTFEVWQAADGRMFRKPKSEVGARALGLTDPEQLSEWSLQEYEEHQARSEAARKAARKQERDLVRMSRKRLQSFPALQAMEDLHTTLPWGELEGFREVRVGMKPLVSTKREEYVSGVEGDELIFAEMPQEFQERYSDLQTARGAVQVTGEGGLLDRAQSELQWVISHPGQTPPRTTEDYYQQIDEAQLDDEYEAYLESGEAEQDLALTELSEYFTAKAQESQSEATDDDLQEFWDIWEGKTDAITFEEKPTAGPSAEEEADVSGETAGRSDAALRSPTRSRLGRRRGGAGAAPVATADVTLQRPGRLIELARRRRGESGRDVAGEIQQVEAHITAKQQERQQLERRLEQLGGTLRERQQRGLLGTTPADQSDLFGGVQEAGAQQTGALREQIATVESEIATLQERLGNLQAVQEGESTGDLFEEAPPTEGPGRLLMQYHRKNISAPQRQFERATRAWNESAAKVLERGVKGVTVEMDQEAFDDALQRAMERMSPQMDVFHGSQHTFDQFNTEKIGSGEGFQAFGWGLYFTGRKDVARWYANMVSDEHYADIKRQLRSDYDLGKYFNDAVALVLTDNNTLEETRETIQRRMQQNRWRESEEVKREFQEEARNALRALNDIESGKLEPPERTRNVYKATLHKGKSPEEYDYLRREENISSDQYNKIRKQAFSENITNPLNLLKSSDRANNPLEALFIRGQHTLRRIDNLKNATIGGFDGSSVYNDLVETLGSQKQASQFLLRAGIDGIQYPSGSLSGIEGSESFNYVVFDENHVTIEERIQYQLMQAEPPLGFYDPESQTVYLNPSKATKDTVFHEFAHPVVHHLKQTDPDLYNEGVDLIRGTYYETDAQYLGYEDSLEEGLVQAIGEKGAQIHEATQRNKFVAWLQRFMRAVRRVFRKMFGLRPSLEEFTTAVTTAMTQKQAVIDVTDSQSGFQFQRKRRFPDQGDLFEGFVPEPQTRVEEKIKRLEEKLPPSGENVVVGKRIATLIQNRIRDIEQGARLENIELREQLRELKKMVAQYAREALPKQGMTRGQVTPIFTGLAEAETLEDVQELYERIQDVAERVQRKQLLEKIRDRVKTYQPTVNKGRLEGPTLTPPEYRQLQQIQTLMQMDTDAVNQAISEVFESVDERAAGAEPTDQAFAEFAPEENLRVYLLRMFGNLKGKSVDELESALSEVEFLIEEGRTKHQLREEARLARMRMIREKAVDILTGGRGVFSAARARAEGLDQPESVLNKFDNYNQGFEWLLDKLERFDTDSEPLRGFLTQYFYNKVRTSRDANTVGVRKINQQLQAKISEIYGITKPHELAKVLAENSEPQDTGITYIDQDGMETALELSQNEAYKLWQWWQDPSLRDTFENMGYTPEVMQQIEDWLTPEVKQWARWQLEEFYPNYYDRVNAAFRQRFYVDLPYNPFYTPVKRDVATTPEDEELLRQRTPYATVLSGHLKLRTQNTLPFRIVDGDQVLAQHIVEMEHFRAWVETVRELRSVLQSAEAQKAIRQYHGNSAARILNNFIDDLARGGVERGKIVNILDKMRSSFTKAVLGLNPTLLPKQLASIPAYAMDIPTAQFLTGVGDFFTNPIEKGRILMQSEMMQARYDVGWERDVKLAMQRTTPKKFAGARNFSDALMVMVRLGDAGAILTGGWSVYRYHKQQALDAGKSEQEAHRIALREFENATKRSQQAGDVEDLSEIQRWGSLGRLFTMFMTAPNAYYRHTAGAIRNLRAGRGSRTENLKRLLISYSILPALFTMVSFGFRLGKDENLKGLIATLLTGSLNGLLWVGDLIEMGARALLGAGWFQADPVPPMEPAKEAVQVFEDIHTIIERGEITIDDVLSVADETAKVVTKLPTPVVGGFPYEPLTRWGEGVYDWATGAPDAHWLRAVGYSRYAIYGQTSDKQLAVYKAVSEGMTEQEFLDELQTVYRREGTADAFDRRKSHYLKLFRIYRAFGVDNKRVNALMKQPTNAERADYLHKLEDRMERKPFIQFYHKARQVGLISDDVDERFQQPEIPAPAERPRLRRPAANE